MYIETEIKLLLDGIDVDELAQKIETRLSLKKTEKFHQITYQFFEDDFSQQAIFPRIRNEENGDFTLTIKAKIKGEENSEYFKRLELETSISNVENTCEMMLLFGFKNKICWEKIRTNFTSSSDSKNDFIISIDETPMGFFLEIESTEEKINEIIDLLSLKNHKSSNKSYLGLWEDYKKEKNIISANMMFSEGQNNELKIKKF